MNKTCSHRVFWFSGVCFVFCALLLPARAGWTSNDAMLAYFGALQIIADQGVESNSIAVLTEQSLQGLLSHQDRYSRYLPSDEYKQIQDIYATYYGGIGLEIQELDSALILVPYPGSPAEKAGIFAGDHLLTVGGISVDGYSALSAASRIRGDVGTEVTLSWRREGGRDVKSATMQRQEIALQTIRRTTIDGIPMIRLFTFAPSTPGELRQAIKSLDGREQLIIDLRNNAGGGLYEAVDAARIFLDADMSMLEVEKRGHTERYVSETSALWHGRIVLLQNGQTASAAEVFIAALVKNGKAVSLGETTYGKGLTQQLIPLLNGGAMLLTDGRLRGPQGVDWNESGLPPVIEGKVTPATIRQAFLSEIHPK
ncbi:MAG: PDZ domain-containing protein [Spartobacteria bacterium]|nr:PDZ domain-containing protein [Spartobacteria bacterium]